MRDFAGKNTANRQVDQVKFCAMRQVTSERKLDAEIKYDQMIATRWRNLDSSQDGQFNRNSHLFVLHWSSS